MPEQEQILRWEAPPPPKIKSRGRPAGTYGSRYDAVAKQLRDRRGEWALIEVGDRANGLPTKIAAGHVLCFTPAGDFEAVARRVDGQTCTYARYLGDGDDA